MRTSSFMSPRVFVHNSKGKVDITDSIKEIYVSQSQDKPFQDIKLKLNMNTLKILQREIGFFKEKYTIILEIFDINRQYVQDKLVIDHATPVKYPDLDISQLSKTLKKDLHNSADIANVKQEVFEVILTNKYVEPASKSLAFLWERDTTFKAVWNKVTNAAGPVWFEKDKCWCPGVKFYQQFFVPFNRLYNSIPSIMMYGYLKPHVGLGAFMITERGLVAYNIKGALKRKKLKTKIYPSRGEEKDFKHIFVTDFYINRDPWLKLEHGTTMKTIGESKFRAEYLHRKRSLKYNTQQEEKILFKGMFDGIWGKPDEYWNAYNPLEDKMITTSRYNIWRKMNTVSLIINRWNKFLDFMPLRHIWILQFSSEILKIYDGKYYVTKYELIVSRHKQEFIPRVKLDFQLLFSLAS